MLLAASESAVTKKPRLRLTTRRSSSVRPFGSFHSWMSRLMLISCGIQWFAQAARYFSQAHLYLNGTSWLTSALELMTDLSSTVTRRKAGAGGFDSRATLAGTNPGAAAKSSNLSILFFLSVSHRLREQHRAQARHVLLVDRLEFWLVAAGQLSRRRLQAGRRRERHLVRRDIEVPVRTGDRHPLGMARVRLDQLDGEGLGLPEVER